MQLRDTRVVSRSQPDSSTGLAFVVIFAVVFIVLVFIVVLDIVGLRTGVMIDYGTINSTDVGSHAIFGTGVNKVFLQTQT